MRAEVKETDVTGFRRFREYDDPTYGRVLVLVVRRPSDVMPS